MFGQMDIGPLHGQQPSPLAIADPALGTAPDFSMYDLSDFELASTTLDTSGSNTGAASLVDGVPLDTAGIPLTWDGLLCGAEPSQIEEQGNACSASEAQGAATCEDSGGVGETCTTGQAPSGHPACSCLSAGTCGHCRLKQRVSRLQAETETLRKVIEEARAIVNKHDDVLQEVHDGRDVPDSAMGSLWSYQDELRKALSLG